MIISRTRLPRFQVRLKNFCCHHGTTLDLLVGNAILIRTSRRTRLRSSVCAFISKKKQKSVVFRVSNHCARCYHTKLVSSSDIRNRRCLRTDPYLQGAHSSLWPIVIVSLSPARDNMSIVTEKARCKIRVKVVVVGHVSFPSHQREIVFREHFNAPLWISP